MIGKSSRIVASMAAIAALVWASTALAVYQETPVTVTDQGKPVPGQTVTLTQKEKDPQQPKKKPKIKRVVKLKTNKEGKIVVGYDDSDKRPDIVYDVTWRTSDGRTRTIRDVTIADLIALGTLDFTNVPATSEAVSHTATTGQPRQPVEPLRYMPSGWTIVIGVNVGGGESWNHYGTFPTFDGSGAGGGGFFAARYYTASGFFIAPEFGAMALNVNGRNEVGAFSKIQWMAFEGAQGGFRFNGPQSTAVNVYFGAGASQAGYKVGIDSDAFSESMSKTLNGWSAHTGFDAQVAPVSLPNLWVGFDYRYSYWRGTIGDDPVRGGVHFFSATASYQFPVAR